VPPKPSPLVGREAALYFLEWRDLPRVVRSLADVIRDRIFAIACGYECGNDLDRLRNGLYRKLLSMKQVAPAVLRLSQSSLASLRPSGPTCAA